MARKTERTPVYLSARSADVILSEIRPTRLKPDALQSINEMLDELLYLILRTSKSLSPTRLKDGLLKLLPTPLGKEAVLEAELELRNHRDGGALSGINSENECALDGTVIEATFEFLRTRCESCTTLNEVDEDFEVAGQTLAKGDGSAFKKTILSSAVFYLTAILEHICQHILSNVGRVVTRDSSRTLASAHDLYIGLCEDDTIYPLFISMNIYEVISAQSSAIVPKKPRSSTSQQEQVSMEVSRTSSPIPQEGRLGRTSESHPTPSRPSFEKNRALKIFRSGSVSDNGHSSEPTPLPTLPHKRSQSQQSAARKQSVSVEDDGRVDDETSQQFDELVRSGQTMKVSLTPDRLQSMETYKLKTQQSNTMKTQRDEPPSPLASHTRKTSVRPFTNNTRVDSIEEDEEDVSNSPQYSIQKNTNSTLYSRNTGAERGNLVIPPARTISKPAKISDFSESSDISFQNRSPPLNNSVSGKVNPSNGRARNRDSLDLDDILNGVVESTKSFNDLGLLPKTATLSTKSDTGDLIDFLKGGPPEEFSPSRSLGSQAGLPPESTRKGGGRFRSMVTRLRSRTSTDRITVDESGLLKPTLKSKGSSPDVSLLTNVPYPRPPRISSTSPSSYNDPLPKVVTLPSTRIRQTSSRKAVPSVDDKSSDDPPPTISTLKAPYGNSETSKLQSEALKNLETTGNGISAKDRTYNTLVNGGESRDELSAIKRKTSGRMNVIQQTAADSTQKGVSKQFAEQLINTLGKAETADECRLLAQMLLRQAGHNVHMEADSSIVPSSFQLPSDSASWALVELLLDS